MTIMSSELTWQIVGNDKNTINSTRANVTRDMYKIHCRIESII